MDASNSHREAHFLFICVNLWILTRIGRLSLLTIKKNDGLFRKVSQRGSLIWGNAPQLVHNSLHSMYDFCYILLLIVGQPQE